MACRKCDVICSVRRRMQVQATPWEMLTNPLLMRSVNMREGEPQTQPCKMHRNSGSLPLPLPLPLPLLQGSTLA